MVLSCVIVNVVIVKRVPRLVGKSLPPLDAGRIPGLGITKQATSARRILNDVPDVPSFTVAGLQALFFMCVTYYTRRVKTDSLLNLITRHKPYCRDPKVAARVSELQRELTALLTLSERLDELEP
jgi:hypothetical protein